MVDISGEAGEVGCRGEAVDRVEGEETGEGELSMVEVRGWRACRRCTGGEG